MTRPLRSLSTLCAVWLLTAASCPFPAGAQEQAADWRPEFEAVCVKTDAAMTLSSEELLDLVSRCDRLAERIGTEGEIVRKVYLKRLNSCRALFAYVLESRGVAPAGMDAPAPEAQAPEPPPAPAQRPSP